MNFVYGNAGSPEVNRFLADFVSCGIFGHPGGFKDFGTLGVLKGSELIAGVVYYDWDQDAGVIQISAYATDERWMTRPVLTELFAIAFDQLRCQLVVIRVSENNQRMISIARRLGFDEYLIPRLGGRHESQYIFTLTDEAFASRAWNRQRAKEAH